MPIKREEEKETEKRGEMRRAEMQRVIDLAYELIAACDALGENRRLASLANAAERIAAEIARELDKTGESCQRQSGPIC